MILKVENLNVSVKESKRMKSIIRNVSFQVEKNQCLGILGESGSGKSITWKSVMGLLDKNFCVEGTVEFNGISCFDKGSKHHRNRLGKDVGVIVQNPMTAFDPLYTMKEQLIETFQAHRALGIKEANKLAVETLERMKISGGHEVLKKYPHELSGGMLQRIMIGAAIALSPSLIIADEPTTAIDSINQVEVLKELCKIRSENALSMIFISHDLGAVAKVADDVLVMSSGEVVERGPVQQIMKKPQSMHTKYLVNTRNRLMTTFYRHTLLEGAV